MLSVSVSDVAPDGTVSRLTGGWQVLSLRQLDRSRSRYLDGRLIQPLPPVHEGLEEALGSGEVAPVDVEVFPTAAEIAQATGSASPSRASTSPTRTDLPDLPGAFTVMTIHSRRRTRPCLTVPAVG